MKRYLTAFRSSKFGWSGWGWPGLSVSEPPGMRRSGGSLRSTPATRSPATRSPNLELLAVILAAIVIGGCGGEDPFDPNRPRRAPATQAGGQLAPVDEQGRPLGGQPAPPLPPPPPPGQPSQTGSKLPPPPPPPDVVQKGVQPGVSGKGEGLGPGLISTPISVYFRVPERLVFNVKIPQAMNLYKAEHGRFPKTHEEFMQKIIADNGIALPDLRSPEERYVYDPQKAARQSQYDTDAPPLLIERPR